MDAGHQFSHTYRLKKDSGYRSDFMTLESPLFVPGQVHFTYWQGVGGYVSYIGINTGWKESPFLLGL